MEPAQQNQADSSFIGSDSAHPIVFGEMRRLIESFDWSRSPLGPSAQWPHSLKTSLNICLRSRFQLAMFWGPELVFLYNDAEREVIGSLHPYALGKPAREVLVDMWQTVGPMLHQVLNSGEATWSVDQPLMIDRYGLVEEAFFTWSYSPIPDDDGSIGGVLLVTAETTQRVLAERRLRTLTEMAAEIAGLQTTEQACATAVAILAQNPADIPCAMLYLLDANGSARLYAFTGTSAPPRERFALDEVIQQRGVIQLDNLAWFFDAEVVDQLPKSAIILPILGSDLENLVGFLVAGVSDHRRLDTDYRDFFDLVAARIGATIASTRAREQERARLDAIAELDHAKTAFFTNISHEFRTPLTLILGVVDDMLAKTDPALRVFRYEELSAVRRNAVRLLRLVNALLDFSGVEAGRVRATYQPTDLSAFTRELASSFHSIMEKAQLTFQVQTHTLPEPVYVDPEMWERIVLNLLSNAFKFTFQGEVAVELSCVQNCAQLVVKDTGIGIQPEELPRIFERFHRVEDARGRTHEGTGIGLALVQELVKLHNGSIRAESVPGKGTTFVVSIPFGKKHLPSDRIREDRSQAPESVATGAYAEEAQRWLGIETIDTSSQFKTSVPSPTGDRPVILVADDNADMRDYLQSLLSNGYTVETVGDGEQALAAIERRKPDLVLADLMMPRLDGFGLLRKLRADPETQSIPVILVSARAGKDEVVEGMKQSADDYLAKPFNSRELLARVQSHIGLAHIRREAAERERKLRAEADSQRALLETVLNQMPAGVVIAKAPSGEVVLANNQATQILQRSVGELRSVEEYSQYEIFRLDGRAYSTQEQPLARSILHGEVVMGEELRYLRPDGTFRVLFTNSGPVQDATGAIVASVVTFQDITDLRLAQEELLRQSNDVIHDLAGKLITAQEEERRRIARDLHDDIAQRIALLSNKIQKLHRALPTGIVAVDDLSGRIQKEIEQILESVRLISHQLHSSTLILGLPRALAGYCREFSQQRGIKVEFTQKGSVVPLPETVPLVMFRVLQESLHNVARHSGAAQVEVSLLMEGDQIRLRVKDRGKGFDPVQISDGLGLVSMRERLRLVGGKIKISSAPGLGTEIEAAAPIRPPHSSAKIPA